MGAFTLDDNDTPKIVLSFPTKNYYKEPLNAFTLNFNDTDTDIVGQSNRIHLLVNALTLNRPAQYRCHR